MYCGPGARGDVHLSAVSTEVPYARRGMRSSRVTKRCSFETLNTWLGALRDTQKLTQPMQAQVAQDGAAVWTPVAGHEQSLA